jgi:hypothetical protein
MPKDVIEVLPGQFVALDVGNAYAASMKKGTETQRKEMADKPKMTGTPADYW